ncbi:MAG TPA: AbrB/MazE/SpoVT family DNA-binding domain-containing protein [Anaerolineales bacterium]|jgi:AbrB family looped-hinge helix DNA binding protein|nr:AbrB/MazE/SpoVT family DNA-binding domain-containing protein [Anaerolineales bacterium]
MSIATISPKGWVVIPAELRKKYDLRPGSRVVLVDYGGILAIVPAMNNPVEESAGRLKSRRSMVKALLAERARERQREK